MKTLWRGRLYLVKWMKGFQKLLNFLLIHFSSSLAACIYVHLFLRKYLNGQICKMRASRWYIYLWRWKVLIWIFQKHEKINRFWKKIMGGGGNVIYPRIKGRNKNEQTFDPLWPNRSPGLGRLGSEECGLGGGLSGLRGTTHSTAWGRRAGPAPGLEESPLHWNWGLVLQGNMERDEDRDP